MAVARGGRAAPDRDPIHPGEVPRHARWSPPNAPGANPPPATSADAPSARRAHAYHGTGEIGDELLARGGEAEVETALNQDAVQERDEFLMAERAVDTAVALVTVA